MEVMAPVFATSGMVMMTIIVFCVQGVSLVVMVLMLFEYRHIHIKRMDLLSAFEGVQRMHIVWRCRLLTILYIVFTLLITIGSSYLYLFQPHIF